MTRYAARVLFAAAIALSIAAGDATAGAASPNDPADDVAIDALIELDGEIIVLIELGGLTQPVPPELLAIHDQYREDTAGLTRPELRGRLVDSDQAGLGLLARLEQLGVPVSPEIRRTLGSLTADDMAALDVGRTITIEPATYVRARQHLLIGNGAGPSGARTEPVTKPVPTQPATQPATVTSTTVEAPATITASDPEASTTPWLPIGIGAVMLAAGTGVLVSRTGRRTTWPRGRPQTASIPGDELFELLADAARQMTAALDTGEIAKIALARAMQFARARHGAFVEVGAGGLTALAATDDVINQRSLASGVLARVAETGQVVRRVAHDEPAITSLPASMLVMPVIGSGRVSAILFLVRPDSMPFTEAEADALAPLASIVGSALAVADRHGDATALSRLDSLTGLGNRRRLDEDLLSAWPSFDGAGRRGKAVVMVDVDHFKHFNDRNGHAAGDAALRAVAEALRAGVREHDEVYRYGGEEFTVLLADVDRVDAERIAERIRIGVAQSDVAGRATQPGGALTVSIGVALVAGLDAAESLRIADRALYEAKSSGRNCVVVVDATTPQPVS